MVVKRRLFSMLFDHMIMSFIFTIPWMIFFNIYRPSPSDHSLGNNLILCGFLLLYVNKDSIEGQSIAKRLLGFQVTNFKSGRPATSLQCLLRNMIIPVLWPIEVLVTIVNPERRIGDRLANTKVEKAEKSKASSILTDTRNMKFSFRTALMNVLIFTFYVIISNLLTKI